MWSEAKLKTKKHSSHSLLEPAQNFFFCTSEPSLLVYHWVHVQHLKLNHKQIYERMCRNCGALQINHHNETRYSLRSHLHFIFLYCGYTEEHIAPEKWKALSVKEVCSLLCSPGIQRDPRGVRLKSNPNEKQHQTHAHAEDLADAQLQQGWRGHYNFTHTFYLVIFLILLKLAFNKRTVWSSVWSWRWLNVEEAAILGTRLAKKDNLCVWMVKILFSSRWRWWWMNNDE